MNDPKDKASSHLLDEYYTQATRPRRLAVILHLTVLATLFIVLINLMSLVEYKALLDSRPSNSPPVSYYDALQYTPEQLHLSLGKNSSEIYVTWSTLKPIDRAVLAYSIDKQQELTIDAVRFDREFTESDKGWVHVTRLEKRKIYTYRAKIDNLKFGKYYTYHVSSIMSDGSQYDSRPYRFRPRDISSPDTGINIAFYGDLGLVNGQSIPRLIRDVDDDMYDFIIHNGDFAYDLNTKHGSYGDEFMRKIEPIAARLPYQTSVGNHEIAENFTHYDHRFTMINLEGDRNNFYYSFNVGPVHFVAISTEFYYFLEYTGLEPVHNQYEWLKRDLSLASSPSERAKRPWIVVFGHRPMYCSSGSRDDCSKVNNILRKGFPFTGTYALEKLFYDYGVDVEIYSHEHQYERFLPIYDRKPMKGGKDTLQDYYDPVAPVHIISGSAGCQERLDPPSVKPVDGSVVQIADYGYTRISASKCSLKFQQVSDDQAGDIVDQFTIHKSKISYKSDATIANQCNETHNGYVDDENLFGAES